MPQKKMLSPVQMLQDLLTDDEEKKPLSAVASQMLLALLLSGDGSAATLVLQHHLATLPSPADEQSLTELESAMNTYGQFLTDLEAVIHAYSTLLSHLNIFATAAHHAEFLGLRRLLRQAVEERLEKEKQQAT